MDRPKAFVAYGPTENCCNVAKFFCVTVFLVIATFGQATAQQTDADFSAYCRTNYTNSSYQRFAQSWGTEHACVQGGTRQGVDLAEACRLTTGNREYEISGARVLCTGSSNDAPLITANDLGSPDLNRYCVETFPNSTYERRAEASGFEHYCRRPGSTGGFVLQPIDLFQVCLNAFGTDKFRKEGVQIFCTSNDGATPAGSAPMSTSTNGPTPPTPPPASFPPLPFPNPSGGDETPKSPNSTPPKTDDPTVLACQSLGGQWQGGTIAMVEGFLQEMDQQIAACTGGPLCTQNEFEQTFQAYMRSMMLFQCNVTFADNPEGKSHDDIDIALKEACEIKETLDGMSGKLNALGGRFDPPIHETFLIKMNIDEFCVSTEEIPDFAELVRELQEKSDQSLQEEFAQ